MVTKRPATDADLELIYRIVRDSLGPYVVQTWGAWNEAEQRRRFDEVTRAEDHSILEFDGQPIGCLCIKKMNGEIRLIRLMVLPSFQNRGFGTEILKEIIASADEAGLPVRLRVLRVNPARRWYERFGFAVVGESETHYMMVRPALV